MTKRRLPIAALSLLVWAALVAPSQAAPSGDPNIRREAQARGAMPLPLLPLPRDAAFGSGTTALSGARIEVSAAGADPRVDTAVARLKAAFGTSREGAPIRLVIKPDAPLGREAYDLVVDASGATVIASTPQGLLYGATTLAQMGGLAGGVRVPRGTIHDAPRLPFRAVMHDIGRSYMDLGRLRQHLDRISHYKVNVFHWHLTENPAWRFEVKAHPGLTRAEFHDQDRAPGKFYTQAEIREVIAYAKARGVTVMPEIDIPGHTAALRRALGVARMDDPKVMPVLRDAFRELLALAPPEDMPYIHMGSDEAHTPAERLPKAAMDEIAQRIHDAGRTLVMWNPGKRPPEGANTLEMLWAQAKPNGRNRFIDARSIYVNLNTGADAVRTTYWNVPATDGRPELRYGGALALWLDIPTLDADIERVSPFWPAVVAFADRAWHGGAFREDLLVTVPPEGTDEARAYDAFTRAVLAHRDAFFRGTPFPFVREDGFWRLLGPLPNDGRPDTAFGPEGLLAKAEPVAVDGKTYGWDRTARGWQVFLRHMFGWPGALDEAAPRTMPWAGGIAKRSDLKDTTVYARAVITSDADREVGFWIQVDPPNASDRREGPNPKRGDWNRDGARIWVNGEEVVPPRWRNPDTGGRFSPPLSDEFCFMRPALKLRLRRGDNVVLLRLPHGGPKWEFVCHPVAWDGVNAREVQGVTFKVW